MQKPLILLLLFALATVIIAIDGALRPERRYLSLIFFIIGVVGTWRQYLSWRQARRS